MFQHVVVVAGVARSGTSWLGEIINSSPDTAYRFQPLFSYAFKGALSEDSSREDMNRFFTGIYSSNDPFLLQQDKRDSGAYPTFHKNPVASHLAFKTCRYQYTVPRILRIWPEAKVIGLVRHPCAALNSWVHNPKEFPPGSNILAEWRFGACKNEGLPEHFFGYYKWREVANLYLDLAQQFPDRFLLVRYRDLVEDTEEQVESVFRHIGLPVSGQTQSFITERRDGHGDNPYSVFRSDTDLNKWRRSLPEIITQSVYEDLRGTRLEFFLE